MLNSLLYESMHDSHYEGEPVPCCEMFGEGNGDIHVRDVACYGTEINVTSCTYTNDTGPLSHQMDVGVQCQQGMYNAASLSESR